MAQTEKKTPSPTVQILAVALMVSLVINCGAAFNEIYRTRQVPTEKTTYSIEDFYQVATEIDQKLTSNGFTLKEGTWTYLENVSQIQKEETRLKPIEVNMTNWNQGVLLFILSIKNFNVICIHKLFVCNGNQVMFLWIAEMEEHRFYALALSGEVVLG